MVGFMCNSFMEGNWVDMDFLYCGKYFVFQFFLYFFGFDCFVSGGLLGDFLNFGFLIIYLDVEYL